MDIKITDKKEEPLLSRIKVSCKCNFDAATPSNNEVKSKIASALNVNESLVVVKSIHTNFGLRRANISAYVYKNEKDKESIGIVHKKQLKKEQKQLKTEASKEEKKPEDKKPKDKKEAPSGKKEDK